MATRVKALIDIHSPNHVTKAGQETEMDDETAKLHQRLGHVEIIKESVKTKERKFDVNNKPN